jgi:hypothetical protein
MIQKEKLDEIFKAKQQIVEGSLTIWNERLTALVQSGDVKGVLDSMLAPVEGFLDNCGCNSPCNGSCLPNLGEELISRPSVTTRRAGK